MTIKKLLSTAFLILLGTGLFAQVIDKKELQEIRGSFKQDASTKALQNILTQTPKLRAEAANWNNEGKVDHFFKYKVKVKAVTDQESSGRCWMFTSMNELRPLVKTKYNISSFDFSHNYLYFWDMFEKSNLFLENAIATASKDMMDRDVVFYFKSPVSDGGVWNLFYNAAQKYGVVPQSVMPETANSNNTSQLNSVLNEKLRREGYILREAVKSGKNKNAIKEIKVDALKDVYRILALTLGEPPVNFTWRYKDNKGEVQTITSTPLEFYKNIIPENFDPQNHIMIMNDPTRPYYNVYNIANYRNTYEGLNWVYLNLPLKEIKEAALASLKDNKPMYTSSDVGKQFNRKNGTLDMNNFDYEALFGVKFNMDKKTRILTRQSGSSHAMLLVACDTDNNDQPIKWELENSWGPSAGNHGYLTLTDEWFSEYIFRIVIDKKFLNEKATKALKTKVINLPAWDYMF